MTTLATHFHSLSQELRLLNSKRPVIRYIGWADHSNLGDWAVEIALEQLFRPHAQLYTKTYAGRLFQKKTNEGWRPDAVMLGGGTLIKRPSATFGRFMQAAGRVRFVFGSGVSDPSFWTAKLDESRENLDRCAAYLRQHAAFVGVRGPLSQTLLTERGVENVCVVGDPALRFARLALVPKPGAKRLGVNVGVTNDGCWGGSDAAVWNGMAAAVRILIARGWSPVFLPVWPSDVDVSRRMARELVSDGSKPWPVRIARTPEEFVRFSEDVDVMLGEKLHSVILAFCAHTPSVMVEYRPKCLDFMASLGLQRFTLRSDALVAEDVAQRVEDAFASSPAIRQELFQKIGILNAGMVTAADHVCNQVLAETD